MPASPLNPFCSKFNSSYRVFRTNGVRIIEVLLYLIRIYQEYEDRIEKSVPRITVWHHEACRVMTNGDLEGRIFLSYPPTNNGFFFWLTTVFVFGN